jgi:formyl-CoA transferase
MYDIMKGVRVVEVAEHTFVPAAAMVLADWGADVIKIEKPQGGDFMRQLPIPGAEKAINPFFEAANRGKRSLGLDMFNPDGQAQFRKLIETADVFITNLRRGPRKKMGIEPEDLFKINPRLIYARGTGYGITGPEAERPGFDWPTAWCNAGAAYMLTPTGGEPSNQPGSVGDLNGAMALAGAVSGALFRRERTGQGCVVDNSLYLTGSWTMCQSILAAGAGSPRPPFARRSEAYDALSNYYQTKDGRWLTLCLLYEKWWTDFLRHIEREDLAADPRYSTHAARRQNHKLLIVELDKIIAGRTLVEWAACFADLEGVWAPVRSPAEVLTDPQAVANGYVIPIKAPAGDYKAVPAPAQFDEQPIGELKASPLFAQHTDEILSEIGLSTVEIESLRAANAVA